MQASYWLERWENQQTGFDLGSPHPFLCKFYTQFFSTESSIFVPLCGKSQDIAFLASNQHSVIGCELSEKAITEFFNANQLKPKVSSQRSFQQFRVNNINLLQGDFFQLTREHLVKDNIPCQAIYDRAALIALPSDMRKAYVEYMLGLFEQAKLMLITLEYPQEQMQGPPFSVDETEVSTLFDFAQVEKVYAKSILEQEPRFIEKGLTELTETVYFIEW
jgi:thiopurine S-methyltransferase